MPLHRLLPSTARRPLAGGKVLLLGPVCGLPISRTLCVETLKVGWHTRVLDDQGGEEEYVVALTQAWPGFSSDRCVRRAGVHGQGLYEGLCRPQGVIDP